MIGSLEKLNEQYGSLEPGQRIERLFNDFGEEDVFYTSSFGTTSVVLLHMLNKVRPGFPVHFIDTGYLFRETAQYRDELTDKLGLNIVNVTADPVKHTFTRKNKTYKRNHDLCCYINKVYPVEMLKSKYKIWIAGLLQYQNPHRKDRKVFEWQDGIVKFHPVLDLSEEDISTYRFLYDLPAHPLEARGYGSVGCIHCTKKGKGRSGRWSDIPKTECGLHI
ncbi:phosphoadenylyl-sulfate reductase [Roseivirga sp. BDSF3-8]|uniref:phosphoadenylyl-sulfate reductase n=1 Tax=Roseivirga sp. BDSF3-8 TaxID=3241598 RepID=UPI0035322A18